jgi:signal transduction histidine kinase
MGADKLNEKDDISDDKCNQILKKSRHASSDTKLYLLKLELLKGIDIFSPISESNLSDLAKNINDLVLSPNDMLFEEGSNDKKMYIILSGQVLVFKGKRSIKQIAVLGQGDYVGEMSLIDGAPRSASAQILSDAVLGEIDENLFQQFIASNPKALLEMMKIFSLRIRHDLDAMTSDMNRIANFTHDMRNCLVPLAIAEEHLTNVSEFLRGDEEKQQKRKGWDKIIKSFNTMQSVKNNLLTMIDQSLACVKKTSRDYIKTEMEIPPLIRETAEEVSCHKYLKGKEVKVFVDGTVKKALYNSLDIKRVLQNLILNAGYASHKGSSIDIHIKDLNDMVQVSVKDYGAGVPDDIKPFLLNENYTSKPDGNGFGLMSCKEIIENLHDGKIFFETEVGKGTTFHFTIGHGD